MPDTISTAGVPLTSDDVSEMRLQLDGLTASQLQLNLALDGGERLGRQFGRTLTNAFVGLAVQGKSFGDVMGTLALSLSKMAVGAAFKPLETAFGSALQSLVSSSSALSGAGAIGTPALPLGSGLLGGGLASLFGAGPAAAPIGGAVASGANIIFNVTTPDANSFYNSETQIAALLARAVSQGQRNL
jgi:hypothetical protein